MTNHAYISSVELIIKFIFARIILCNDDPIMIHYTVMLGVSISKLI